MTKLFWHDSSQQFILDQANPDLMSLLADMRTTLLPHGQRGIKSPYTASMFYHQATDETKPLLQKFAWNYQNSFAEQPIVGLPDIEAANGDIVLDPYQVAGVQLITARKSTILADSMGLGKTIAAVQLLNHLKPQRVMICLPGYLAAQFAREIVRFCTFHAKIEVIDTATRPVPKEGIVLVPHSRVQQRQLSLMVGEWDAVIIDEAEAFSNPEAKKTIAMFGGKIAGKYRPGIVSKAKRLLYMTGTPSSGTMDKLFVPWTNVSPEMKGYNFDKFKQVYCCNSGYAGKVSGALNPYAMNAELRASGAMVRRLVEDVLPDLPGLEVRLAHRDPTDHLQQLILQEAELYELAEIELDNGNDLDVESDHISTIRKEIEVLKVPYVAPMMTDIIGNEGVDRVFGLLWHKDAIEACRELLERVRGLRVLVIQGGMTSRKKDAAVLEFQDASTQPTILLGQVASCCAGLNLYRAHRAVQASLSWVPSHQSQAHRRIARRGQKRNCIVDLLTFPHSCDEKVLRRTASKQIDIERALDLNLMNRIHQIHA